MSAIDKEIRDRFRTIINSRLMAIKEGKPCGDDLLGTLLKSNFKEIERQGNNKNAGLCLDEIISECRLFYFAGQDTTRSLLAWTCVLLCRHQDWQEQAREEALQLFRKEKLDFNRVQNLKIVTMILNEVLRLYRPVIEVTKVTYEETKLGDLTIPAGVQLMMPSMLLHRDQEMWGQGCGRVQSREAKMALAMILQRFHYVNSSAPIRRSSHLPQAQLFMSTQINGVLMCIMFIA
ncbi:secologanin synthase 2-like [Cornus florida]|uniref:secologanin synthase 2-like n=1 Tax=Cornus florida TaxID=4283 RepID=UPI0028A0D5EB|nr:secologanin synthase 2-like [Cornus florida]